MQLVRRDPEPVQRTGSPILLRMDDEDMRYEVRSVDHPNGCDIHTEWMVWDNAKGHNILADDGYLLESAAHIIAFALNSVADGKRLEAITVFPNGTRGGKDTYEGPTEGVLDAVRSPT